MPASAGITGSQLPAGKTPNRSLGVIRPEGTTRCRENGALFPVDSWGLKFNIAAGDADELAMGLTEPGGLVANQDVSELVDLDHYHVDLAAASILPEAVARRCRAVPLGRKFGAPVLALADPSDIVTLDDIRAVIGRDFVPLVARGEQIDHLIDRLYGDGNQAEELGPKSEHDQPGDGQPSAPDMSVISSQDLVDPVDFDDVVAGMEQDRTLEGQLEVDHRDEHDLAEQTEELRSYPPIGRLLVESGRISLISMREVVGEHDRTGEPVAQILTARRLVTEADLMWATAQEVGLDFVDLDLYGVDPGAALRLPETTARHHQVLVVGERDGLPVVATSNPTNVFAMDDVRTILGRNFVTLVGTRTQIAAYIDRAYSQTHDASAVASSMAQTSERTQRVEELSNLQAVVDDSPVVRYVNLLILQALNERASDIHVEPTAENLRIRYRIDGVLHDMSTAPKSLAGPVITRLKVMADINIAEHRIPQDGRISLAVADRPIDVRIATLPTIHGEKIVMRIIDKSNVVLGFEDLGFDDDLLTRYRDVFTKPNGTILVTGPTGSGKTTTLYATLSALNTPEKNIITVEDPVELRIKGINQIQLNMKAGLNFASALRSILRADPDIVLVGEIRDRDTAMISIEASLTGHLVLATLHTNDAASTPMRLVEMGIERYLVTSAVSAAVAQRLARKLCTHCREPYAPTETEIVAAGWSLEEVFALAPEPKLYRAIGCSACSRTGYRGRKALLELLVVTDEIDRMIIEGASVEQMHKVAVEQGMVPLRQSGLRKALEGDTTLEEVLRVVA